MLNDISGDTPRRGEVRRADKIMSAEEVREFLVSAYCGRTATVGADGYPYVVPNLFVWMDERIFLHTARQRGHFLANVEFCDRVCFEADQPGKTFPRTRGMRHFDRLSLRRGVWAHRRRVGARHQAAILHGVPVEVRTAGLLGTPQRYLSPHRLDHPLLDRPGDHDGQADPDARRRKTLAARRLTRRCTVFARARALAAAGPARRPAALDLRARSAVIQAL